MTRRDDRPTRREMDLILYLEDAAAALQLAGIDPDRAWRIAGEAVTRRINSIYRDRARRIGIQEGQ